MYRAFRLLIAGGALVSSFIAPQANAAWFGYPKALKSQFERIGFQTPTAASPASTNFRVRDAEDCGVFTKSSRESVSTWRIGPGQGGSHETQACGWPSSTELLTKAVRKEHHLLFVVNTGTQDQWASHSIASQS
jgi:hypothetical protein